MTTTSQTQDIQIGDRVTARNPGGREVQGIYVGPGRYPNTVAVEWSRDARVIDIDIEGTRMVDIVPRTFVGSFRADSMRAVTS